jgi:hypothetical protein
MCQHVSHIPASTTGDEGWDRFSFTIRLEDYKRKIEERGLYLCVRFSVDGHEWWDSNEGDNYRFNFKRASVRKTRSAPTPLRGGGAESTTQVPLRAPRSADKSLRNWLFPRNAAPVHRIDSPQQSPPPAAAFQPPSTPDVHSFLRLKRYCAPESPPKMVPIVLAPVRVTAATPSEPMTLVHGHPATSWPPTERDGRPADMVASDSDEANGETTPRGPRAGSPAQTSSPPQMTPNTSEDEAAPKLAHRPSTPNLRALVEGTPPSSNLSSPPTPSTILPDPILSTGDSSPVNTLTDSPPHDSPLAIDPRGRMLNASTYQEFVSDLSVSRSDLTSVGQVLLLQISA